MTREQGHVENWIGKNLWTIVALAVTATAGYIAGTTRTTMTLEQVLKHQQDQDARLDGQDRSLSHIDISEDCAARNFDMLWTGTRNKNDRPNCSLGRKE